jgi:hypothetical protein
MASNSSESKIGEVDIRFNEESKVDKAFHFCRERRMDDDAQPLAMSQTLSCLLDSSYVLA